MMSPRLTLPAGTAIIRAPAGIVGSMLAVRVRYVRTIPVAKSAKRPTNGNTASARRSRSRSDDFGIGVIIGINRARDESGPNPSSSLKIFVEDDGVAQRAVRIQCVSWNDAHLRPSRLPVQRFRRVAAFRVERQQRDAGGFGAAFDLLHQHRAEALAACAAMHEKLRNVGAMRLIRHRCGTELDGAGNAVVIACDENDACVGEIRTPPLLRRLKRRRVEKADRGTGGGGIEQEEREVANVVIANRQGQLLDHHRRLRVYYFGLRRFVPAIARLPRPLLIAIAWTVIAIAATGLVAVRLIAIGKMDRFVPEALTDIAIIPLWALATPWIFRS